jgi:hypothetical protein
VAGVFTLVAFVLFGVVAFRTPTLQAAGALCLCVAVMALVLISRIYIVRLQDRIIRLEMRLRLERLGRGADFLRLAHPQIIALRFASDEEMPDLIDRALSERLSATQIKQAVKDWQADWYRT